MNTRDFIAKLGELDVRVWVESDQLRVSAPQGALTPELRGELLERKAELMKALLSSGTTPIRRVESDQGIPLSCAQERIWVFDRLEPGNTTYNTEILLELEGELDRAALARSLAEVVRRHEPLRTTFQDGENGPIQRISPPEPVDLRVVDLSTLPSPEREEEERRAITGEMNVPFQLDRDGLLRATLIQRSDKRQLLILVTHHIVADGSSLLVLAQELTEFYRGFVLGEDASVAELPIRFSDYARWQRDWLEGEGSRKLRAYWSERLAGELPVLELPTDRVRLPLQSYRGGSVTADIDLDTIARMREVAQEGGATLFTLLLAAFKAVLYRHCGQEDLIVGAAVQGRERVETRDLIGMFVNTVAIRTDLSGQPSFRDLLGRVRESGQGALAHAELPFDKVVEMINPPRDRSRPPVFQALFNAFNEEAPEELLLPGLRVSAPDTGDLLSWLELESKFDLTVYSRESGNGLQLVLVYNADLFDHGRMETLLGHYRRLLTVVVNDPDCRIGDIELLSEAERAATLTRGSVVEPARAIDQSAPEAPSLVSRFSETASRWADRVSVKGVQSQCSYRELDQRSDRVAALVLETVTKPHARVGVLCAPEPELLAALLGILKAGQSFVPLDPVNPTDRLEQMVADAGIEVILADRANAQLASHFEATSVLFVEDIVASTRAVPVFAPARPDAEAYVLYTSGSTGTPKGVVQRYENLLCHVDGYARSIGICESDRVSLVSSYGFDAALVDIFGALLSGAALIPMDLHQRGTHRLQDRLLEEQITVYHSTPTVFRALMDFSSGDVFPAIRTVVLGGESVRRSDIDAFREHFPRPSSLVNLYGASESTTALQFFVDADTELDQGSVPLGFPVDRTEAILLDEAGQPASVVGELAIKSGQVACGYLNRPEHTEQAFLPVAGENDVRLYKTGDLARRRPDGALVFLGRKDHQIKLRGYRVEPGEIESVLEQHDAVSRSVVRLEGQGEYEQLVAFVSGPTNDATIIQTLRHYLTERLPAYMVPARLEVLSEMPLTTTGKVDRTRLPEVSTDSTASDRATPPRDAIEQTLASIWSEVLQRHALGVFQDFFELGGSSLQATQIVSRAERVLEREVLLRDFFAAPTIAGMAEHLKTDSASSLSRFEPKSMSRPDVIPLSYSQERMWFVQQLNPMNTAYNICVANWLEGALDESAMTRSFQFMVSRHESLRTKIRTTDGIPFQFVDECPDFAIEWVDAMGATAEERRADARKIAASLASAPFDLAEDLPLRVMMIRVNPDSQLIVVVMHHAVSDRWSLGIMGGELVSLYNALQAGETPSVPPLPVQYADYSVWQREWLQGERLDAEMDYWRKQLDGIQPLSLLTDRPRHARLSLEGERIVTALPEELVSNINSAARRAGATPFMVLLAGFNALLSRYALSDDISLGVPIANRLHVDIEPLIGTFVNTLVLRNDLSGDPTFVELLDRVRGVALEAYGHQNLPFEKLVSELTSDRDMSRAPLVQVLFNVANAPVGRGGGLVGLVPEPEMLNNGGAQFDLTLSVRLEEPAFLMLNYNKELFDPSTAQQISTHYLSLLEEALHRPDAHLSELSMLTVEERARLLETWNATAMEYPRDSTYVSLFEQQVQRTPESIAVECGDESLSYAMLDARAEEIAALLRARAVGRGARVAILMERGLDMIVSLLGVMKSGAAYVPLDPTYPVARLDYVLEDSGAVVVLTETQHADMLAQSTGMIVCVDALGESDGEMGLDAGEIASGAGPEDAAYVIYTSGSTGKPKGVVIPNRALVNFLFTMAERPGLAQQDVLAAVTTVSFDIAGLELYLPLMLGGRVALLKKEETEDPYRLADCLERVGATVMQATPATWRMLIDIGWQGAPRLKALCGGEPLPLDLVNSLLPLVGELWNMYGPTETTIWSTIERVEDAESPVLIGKPIGNTRIYILDGQGRPVPAGVPGEIHIAGDGVAIGYHQRVDLTEERFVSDPFDDREARRMYRTGDLGRFKRDGRIEHLGRIDHQVKIRGYRIELGEIESVLVSHAAVRESVCVVKGDRLVAYIVYEPDQDLMVTEVRHFLSEDLPAFMIPSIVVTVDVLPLTPNGKIDRNSLPDPFEQGSVAEREYVEPDSEIARMMADIWSELLGVERVGTQDNFFDLGGHSLLAMQVVARLEQRSGNRIDPRSMFFQTLEQIVSDAEAELPVD